MKRFLILVVLVCATSMGAFAQKGYYNFDNVTEKTILNLFLQAKNEGRKYPTIEQFEAADISAADIEFIRSHVKRRQIHNPVDRLNTNVYEKRQLLACLPMGNGSGGVVAYPNDQMEHSDVYSMWNYTQLFGSWNHGFFQAPGAWVDAAHRNGTLIQSGKMMFDSHYGGAGPNEWIAFFTQKDSEGKYIYVEPYINALMYFGQDGITYNWEAERYAEPLVYEFYKEAYKKAKEYGFTDYNSLMYIDDIHELNSSNVDYVYGKEGSPTHALFLNYNGYNIPANIERSQAYAETYCGGTDRLYAGIYLDRIDRNYTSLKTPGAEHIGLALWGEHENSRFYSNTEGATNEAWQTDYQNLLERYFSGGNNNPAKRPEAAGRGSYGDDMARFEGMAEYFPERSTIAGKLPFVSHFNLGNGEYYYYNGVKQTKGGWYNMSAQDLVPTYRWLTYDAGTTNANTALKVAFTHTDAYLGGSSVSIRGNAGSGVDLVLYKTGLTYGAGAKAKVALKNISSTTAPTVKLLLKVAGEWKTYTVNTLTSAWREMTIDLSDIAGSEIQRIGLRIEGDADILLGKIELNDNQTQAPKAIKAVAIPTKVFESIDAVSVKLNWTVDAIPDEFGRSYNSDNNIDHFEIVYQTPGSNEEIEVGRTAQWATIAAHVPFATDQKILKIGVRAVSTDLKTKSATAWTEVEKGTPTTIPDPADVSGQDGIYDVNLNEQTPHSREDRYIKHIGLKDASANLQKYPDNDSESRISQQLYLDATERGVFDVVAGQEYTPYIDYKGLWMSCYVYVDWDNSGDFSITDNITFDSNNKPTRNDYAEIVSYSGYKGGDDYFSWYKSDGSSFSQSTFPRPGFLLYSMPKFRIPVDQPEGTYRMRVKLDWDNLDPGGNTDPKNLIYVNGGNIIDVLINVHPAQVKVGAKAENGNVQQGSTVLTEDMNGIANFKQDLILAFQPAEGYELKGATVRHGYNLLNKAGYEGDGKWNDVGNRQWWEETLDFTDTNYTLPARLINGNVLITPIFTLSNGIKTITAQDIQDCDVYDLVGRLVRKAGNNTQLAPGVYVVKGQKFIWK